jgi:hypothetical protein
VPSHARIVHLDHGGHDHGGRDHAAKDADREADVTMR